MPKEKKNYPIKSGYGRLIQFQDEKEREKKKFSSLCHKMKTLAMLLFVA